MDEDTKIKMKNPLVSVLMLTYNRAQYITEAIDSVLSQTYKSLELIIIDDGSTDNTSSVVRDFKDSRIKYIQHHENKGLAIRRTESIFLAKGDYVAIIDSDDIWIDRRKLDKQVAHLNSHSRCSIVGSFIKLINEHDQIIGRRVYSLTDQKIRFSILMRNQFAHSSVLIRATSLKKINGYRDIGLCEDLDLFLRLGLVGELSNIPEFTTFYRIHEQRESSQKILMKRSVLNVIKIYKNLYSFYYFAKVKYITSILFTDLFTIKNEKK